MPVKPVDFRTKTLELAEANGWAVRDLIDAPFPPGQTRHLISRGNTALVAYFTPTKNFAHAMLREETINRYVVLEQVLTAPEDSVTVVKKPGELTGFTVRHTVTNTEGETVREDPETDWPTMITAADHITAQRYSAETTEWYTVGSAQAYGHDIARHWIVGSPKFGGRFASVGETEKMTERDMRRAVIAILREMC